MLASGRVRMPGRANMLVMRKLTSTCLSSWEELLAGHDCDFAMWVMTQGTCITTPLWSQQGIDIGIGNSSTPDGSIAEDQEPARTPPGERQRTQREQKPQPATTTTTATASSNQGRSTTKRQAPTTTTARRARGARVRRKAKTEEAGRERRGERYH